MLKVLLTVYLIEDYCAERVGGTKNALRDVVFRALIWSGKYSAFGA
jgi:hypothetical protein